MVSGIPNSALIGQKGPERRLPLDGDTVPEKLLPDPLDHTAEPALVRPGGSHFAAGEPERLDRAKRVGKVEPAGGHRASTQLVHGFSARDQSRWRGG